MRTVELFAGTGSFSDVMENAGHSTHTVELDIQFDRIDVRADVRTLKGKNFPKNVKMLWASPPCQGFSVAVIGRNWNHDGTPKTESALVSMELVQHTMRLINEIKPTYWFIENPRGMLRKMKWFEEWVKRQGGVRHTVSYCQYGDTRQKPTDIWTNATWWHPKPICSRGAPCHVAAPRGSRTGTQGLKGAAERGRIPAGLFEEIVRHYGK